EQSAAWYGLAYSAWQKKDLEGVRHGLANASSGGHQLPEIAGLSVELAMQEGDHVGAAKQATAAWQRWPDSQGVALARVEAMQKSGQDQQAIAFIGELIGKWPEVPRLYQLRAQSYERVAQKIDARRTMAKYYE